MTSQRQHIRQVMMRTLGYAIFMASTLIMLFGLVHIYFMDEVVFFENNRLILVSEIFLLSMGVILLLGFIKNDIFGATSHTAPISVERLDVPE